MENYKVILCGKLYDGLSDTLQEQMEILVKGNQIIEVDKNVAKPAGTETIDLSHLTVTPGLIDAHVHYGTGKSAGMKQSMKILSGKAWLSSTMQEKP